MTDTTIKEKPTVVLTGGFGFIGRNLLDYLLKVYGPEKPDIDFIVIDSAIWKQEYYKYKLLLKEIQNGPIDEGIEYDLFPSKPFYLIHAAWAPASERNNTLAQQAAANDFSKLLDTYKDRILGVIGIGSSAEYGENTPNSCEESDLKPPADPPKEIFPYGFYKYAACRKAHSWHVETGKPVIWLRPFTVFGPGQNGDMLIPSLIKTIEKGQEYTIQNPDAYMDLVHVSDVAKMIARCLRQIMLKLPEYFLLFDIINVCTGIPTNVQVIAKLVCELAGKSTSLIKVNDQPKSGKKVNSRIGNPRHARAVFRFQDMAESIIANGQLDQETPE